MSPLPAQAFTGITPAKFDAIAANAEKQTGVAITGLSGKAAKNGFTLAWSYDPATGALSIQCLDKPWIVPAGVVTATILDLVESA